MDKTEILHLGVFLIILQYLVISKIFQLTILKQLNIKLYYKAVICHSSFIKKTKFEEEAAARVRGRDSSIIARYN